MKRMDPEVESTPLLAASSQSQLTSVSVYPIIQMIREDAIHYVDTALAYEALTSPEMTYSLVRPLTEKYNKLHNMAVPFCLLLNRANFLRDGNIATRGLSQSRAELCEILAIRTLRHWAADTLDLATVLTTSWIVFNGADEHVMAKIEDSEEDVDAEMRVGNALEMAILGRAKRFIKSAAAQKIIDGIWAGRIIYSPDAFHSFLSDTYKKTPVHFYDPTKAPLLDHYRLKVPAIRSVLEYMNFLILFLLFITVLETNEIAYMNAFEWLFMVYGIGFTVDRLATMQEHGIRLYSSNLWNGFDMAFIMTFLPYVTLRVYGSRENVDWAREWSIDILAVAAVFMFPRLAFVSLSNNLMILSLRSMFTQFFQLMALAVFCFAGFLYALWTFGKAKYTAAQVAWWMTDLWFGLDASGFEKAAAGDFHPYFGPPLMAVYACCSNTLLLTVLVSILSHTFSSVVEDAAAEAMFRKAVTTIEGVKADVLFSYQPPLNLFAFMFMFPLSFILSPRWFHKVNVLMIRITAFPILLTIGIYERSQRPGPTSRMLVEKFNNLVDLIPRRLRPLSFLDGLSGQEADIDTIFEIEAQVVDDVINEHTRSSIAGGHASRPQSPSRRSAFEAKTPKSDALELPTPGSSPSTPGIHFPISQLSPGQMSSFSGRSERERGRERDSSPPPRGRDRGRSDAAEPRQVSAVRSVSRQRNDDNGADANGNPMSVELFRSDSEPSDNGMPSLPTILRTAPQTMPVRPALPPRHVRTRRDSHAVASFRVAALASSTANAANGSANAASNGSAHSQSGVPGEAPNYGAVNWAAPDPYALNPPMNPPSILTEGALSPSPLARLYGSVVVEEESAPGGNNVAFATTPTLSHPQLPSARLRTTSGISSHLEPMTSRHRRVSSSNSIRPLMFPTSDHLPETVEEAVDDEEEAPEVARSQDREVFKLLEQMQKRQARMEEQMQELLQALSRR
ncbi:hypothetical protein DL93DRAFT_345555 [Clavulina sp. PMI_390]|nr:hypothetical protein DL93DRAFT_345555 [Clavulina sp. PMI_390]